MNWQDTLKNIGKMAKLASYKMAKATTAQKNEALSFMAQAIRERRDAILEANRIDVEAAKKMGLPGARL
jgi:glutamate-5-semialdehyde dehydrogenase